MAAEHAWAKIIFLHNQKEGSWSEVASQIFTDFDTDGNGNLDKEELHAGLLSMGKWP